jgi:hypothetical protein
MCARLEIAQVFETAHGIRKVPSLWTALVLLDAPSRPTIQHFNDLASISVQVLVVCTCENSEELLQCVVFKKGGDPIVPVFQGQVYVQHILGLREGALATVAKGSVYQALLVYFLLIYLPHFDQHRGGAAHL